MFVVFTTQTKLTPFGMSKAPFAGPCRVLAIANNKGGVAKTTSTVSLGSCLRGMGYRVLLVDMDPQANLTTNLAGKGFEPESHMGDVLSGALPLQQIILSYEPVEGEDPEQKQPGSNLDFAPASYLMNLMESGLQKKREYPTMLRTALRNVRPFYDFILIDTPPNLQTYMHLSLTAADAWAIPVEPELFGQEGLIKIMEAVESIKDVSNPSLQLLGLFFTRFNPNIRNSTHQEIVDELTKEFGADKILQNIRKDASMIKAQRRTHTILYLAPESKVASDYRTLAHQLLARLTPIA